LLSERKEVHSTVPIEVGVIHQLFVCPYALDALNMAIGAKSSKPRSQMHLCVVKFKDAYLKFTQMANISIIGT
jgi:hypothetical protein